MVLWIVLYTSLSLLRDFTDKSGLLQIPDILFHASILSLEAGFCFISYEETKAIENLNSLVESFHKDSAEARLIMCVQSWT